MTEAKPARFVNELSHVAIQIFSARRREDGTLHKGAQGTAFLWQESDVVYVITNWHNVTGWDAVNQRALSPNAFTPTCLHFTIELKKPVSDGIIARDYRAATLDLYDDAGVPQWLEHPVHGSKVDVIALRLAMLGEADLLTKPVNKYEFTDFMIMSGDDAFVIGYPLGIMGGPNLPIWKRASVASEPEFDIDGLPKVLIDTATRRGMSGSPTVAIRRGLINPRGIARINDKTEIGMAENFLGVYSGRLDDDPLGAQIGVVWKALVIDEIIKAQIRGRAPFD